MPSILLFIHILFLRFRYKFTELHHNDLKFSDREVWANRPDLTASEGAVWSGSTLFVIPSATFIWTPFSMVKEQQFFPVSNSFFFDLYGIIWHLFTCRMKEDEWFVVRWEELENLRKRDVLSEYRVKQIRVVSDDNLSHIARKPAFAICKRQRRRLTKISRIASLISWAGQFVSYLVANPEDRSSQDEAHLSPVVRKPVFWGCDHRPSQLQRLARVVKFWI